MSNTNTIKSEAVKQKAQELLRETINKLATKAAEVAAAKAKMSILKMAKDVDVELQDAYYEAGEKMAEAAEELEAIWLSAYTSINELLAEYVHEITKENEELSDKELIALIIKKVFNA